MSSSITIPQTTYAHQAVKLAELIANHQAGAQDQSSLHPLIVGALRDRISAGLPTAAARKLALAVTIPAGTDHALVWRQFMAWLMSELAPVSTHAAAVAALYQRDLAGEPVADRGWRDAADAAANAATDAGQAAYAAADAAYIATCVTAGRAAADAAAYAAGRAADYADAAAH